MVIHGTGSRARTGRGSGRQKKTGTSEQQRGLVSAKVERVQSEIGSALAGIKIVVETIAPWVRAVGGSKNIESAQFRR
jgi:hypothetical protein